MRVNAEVACSREVFRVPRAIQPHGALLAVDPQRGMSVVSASRNLAKVLAGSPRAQAPLGRSIGSILGSDFDDALRQRFRDGRLRGETPWQSTLRLDGRRLGFELSVHAHAGLILVELERAGTHDEADALTSMRQLSAALADLRDAGSDLAELARAALRGVRLLTGYERVLILRLDAEGNGETLAEDKAEDWTQSLEGLCFPARDIQLQARELHRCPVRWVPDRDAVPALLDTDPAWIADQSPPHVVDLTFVRLRSAPPAHLRRHRNMGVNGSMSLSIMRRERLWGLVVCHHRRPHHPSSGQRAAAAALADAFAHRIGLAERTAAEQARRGDLLQLSALLAHMARAELVVPALTAGNVTICGLFDSIGAAVVYDGAVALLGQVPPEAEIRKLTGWLRTQVGAAKLFHTDNMAAAFHPWEQHAAIASGVLAAFLSADQSDVLLWFRPEEPQLVSWGGSVREATDGRRASPSQPLFERWVETRHGVARPWAGWELDIAESVRHGVNEVAVRSLRRVSGLHDKLRQDQGLEVVGQLTGGIAHDFNNLLTGITGSLELMRVRVAQGRYGDLDHYIGTAMTSADRGASLIHRLLAFSRRQTLNPKVVDFSRLAISLEDVIRRVVGPAVHVETATSGDLWETFCDAMQLENALLNLAANARDAMPAGGRLTIVASNAYLDDACAGRHEVASGHYVAVSVADTGTGMAPEVVARVFEPFFTTKPLGQGTGLGLSMVYGFTKQSNGSVRIYSKPGRGTTVRLYLPRHAADEADAADPLLGVANAVETVLVVDGEPVVRLLIGDVLRDLGYEVIEASDGAEGLCVLQSAPGINLLVSNIGLPGDMDGRQFAEAVRARQPQLKVLFVTGYAESALLGTGVLGPDVQVLTKPFALEVLAAKVQAMM